MSNRIVAGLDGSDASLAAVDWAAREAELHTARLDVVHVDDWPDEASFAVPSPAVRRRWADDLLSRTRERILLEHPALEVVTHRIDGQRAAEVLTTAATDADMLVLGARGLRFLTGFLVGQVGSATVRTAEMPVVLVRPTAPTTSAGDSPGHVESVVLGVDVRSDCASLFAFAFEEADRRGCPLTVIHAWTSPLVFARAPVINPGVEQEVGNALSRQLSGLLGPWKEKYPRLATEARVLIGQPAVQILDAAAGASLVVVGRRIRHSAVGARVGAITHAVMHHATSPVAVVAHH